MGTKLLAVFTIMLLSAGAFAAEKVKLYKEFYYGQSKASVTKLQGAEKCDNLQKGAVCLYDQTFAGSKWDMILGFENNGLTQVILLQDFDVDDFEKIVATVENNGHTLVMMQTGGKIFDVVVQSRTSKDISDAMTKFEAAGIAAGEMLYSFLALPKKLPNNVENVTQLMKAVPESTRGVDIVIQEDDEDAFTSVMFYAPIKDEKARVQKAQSVKESF